MKQKTFTISRSAGDKKVKLQNDGYGMDLLTMRNGFQWSGMPIDNDIVDMLLEVLNQYKEKDTFFWKTN